MIHILSAAFLLNIFLLPVLILNRWAGFVLFGGINFLYLVYALMRYYEISAVRAILTLPPTAAVLFLMLSLILVVAAYIAMTL